MKVLSSGFLSKDANVLLGLEGNIKFSDKTLLGVYIMTKLPGIHLHQYFSKCASWISSVNIVSERLRIMVLIPTPGPGSQKLCGWSSEMCVIKSPPSGFDARKFWEQLVYRMAAWVRDWGEEKRDRENRTLIKGRAWRHFLFKSFLSLGTFSLSERKKVFLSF